MPVRRPLVLLLLSAALCSMGSESRAAEPGPGTEPEVAEAQMPRVPATEPDRAADTFAIRPGFHAELVAAEPLVNSPVAMAVDEMGRAYVVEMRDYSERRPEKLGRIRRLEDTDGDGRYDRATVFLDQLPWPTAVTCWDGGVFIGATPDIVYAKDTDGDGVADVREPVFTGFASDYAPFATNRLNVQALMNSLQWGLDNRIHGATSMSGGKVQRVDSPFTRAWWEASGAMGADIPSDAVSPVVDLRGRDFSFDPRTLALRAETGGGQHGMSFDDTGRKFVCSNSDHLQLIAFDAERQPPNPVHELPAARGSIASDGPAAEVYRRSPDEPWRVLRTRWRVAGIVEGMVEGGGRASGYFTGATGTTLYRGDAYGPGFAGDAFIGDAGGNLVHRKKLRPIEDGFLLTGERAADESHSEFLASTDNWFRPVQFYNGPDGCLWVLDMYRETIEHPWSIPANLKARLDLDNGRDRGRIWRLAPDGFKESRSRLGIGDTRTASLVSTLAHSNGWHRDTAARLIYQRGDTNAAGPLTALLQTATNGIARLHAMYALEGINRLTPADLAGALADSDPAVRRHALRLAGYRSDPALHPSMAWLAADPDPWVRLVLALELARWTGSDRIQPIVTLLRRGPTLVREAALHAVGPADAEVFRDLGGAAATNAGDRDVLVQLARLIGRRNDPAAVAAVIHDAGASNDSVIAFRLVSALGEGLRQAGSSLTAADTDHRLDPLRMRAQSAAAGGTPQERRAAVECLAQFPWDSVRDPLASLLTTTNATAVQAMGVQAVGLFPDSEATTVLVRSLPELRPQVRGQAVALLLRKAAGTRALLDAVESGKVSVTDVTVEQMNGLRRHADTPVRDRSRRLFGEPPASRADVVTHFLPVLNRRGDSARGSVIFNERCATCHAFRGTGVVLGPDLASVVSNGQEKLMVSILDPNREVAPNFTAWTAETKAGEEITGILMRESKSAVTLRQAGGTETTVPRSELVRLRPDGRSLMPEGLETGWSVDDLSDLLAWLTAGK